MSIDPGEIYDEVTLKFTENWRETCNKRPVYEVKFSNCMIGVST